MYYAFPLTIVSKHFYCAELITLFINRYYLDMCIDEHQPDRVITDLNQRIERIIESYGYIDDDTSSEEIDFLESSVAERLFDLIQMFLNFYHDWYDYWDRLNFNMKFKILDVEGTFVMSFHPY